MSDLIRRDDVLRSIEEWYARTCKPETLQGLADILAGYSAYKDIAKMPAVDAEPVRHGKWVLLYGTYGSMVCSECGGEAPSVLMGSEYEESRYCPTCGAKMDGREKEE